MILLLLTVLIFMAVVMSAGWATQRAANNGGWSDVFWTYGTGVAAVFSALVPLADFPAPIERRALIAVLAAVWASRLGTYIAARVTRGAEDSRYADLRKESGAKFQRTMFGLLIVQAPVTTILCLAIALAAHAPGPAWAATDFVAVAILAIAIGGETLADLQMARFKANPANRGQICDTGLWGWSRHPNYVFEWFGWLAYPAAALTFGLDRPWVWLTLPAPVVMYLILTRVSGVPPLERSMAASKGAAFAAYRARVPEFFPLPPAKRATS